jgi:AraC family transcriptional regulator
VLGSASRELMRRLYHEVVAFDAGSPLVLEGLMLALLGVSGRERSVSPRGVPPWLAAAEEYIRANYTNALRVQSVAEAVRAPAVQLSRWFRRVHGCTIGEFARDLRVEHAARLLATSALPITDIALLSGFVDHAHLTKTFRRMRHVTPREFRAISAATAGPRSSCWRAPERGR